MVIFLFSSRTPTVIPHLGSNHLVALPSIEIDDTKLQNGKYKLGIVLSSSVDGAYFRGAVGSTLYVDELELICKE